MPPRAPARSVAFDHLTLPDPVAATARQLDRDRQRTAWKPTLLERKQARMRVSAFAWLRGTAPLFYELLAACPPLADGPDGEGWIIGDLHLENYGAYRIGANDEVVFDLNDFDDAVQAPWRWDVLRLLTSVILAARQRAIDGVAAVALARRLALAHAAVLGGGRVARTPDILGKLVENVAGRKRGQLLDSRTETAGGKRRFVRGDRYEDLPESGVAAAAHALKTMKLAEGDPPPQERLEVIDAAFRIAGTGSLGCRRAAVLTEGRGGPDGTWVFDLKEEFAPAAEFAGIKSALPPNERVVTAMTRCLAHLPRMLGTTSANGRPMIVRRFMPQEDKLEAAWLSQQEFASIVEYFGGLAARAHLRGAEKRPARAWSEQDCEELVARATVMAGWHEATYLAFCRTLGESA